MNKKVLATIAMATIGLSSIAYVNADFSERGLGFMWKMNLTDEQITEVESMTTEEKQAFFEEIRSEKELEREARETVIDKLLAWETLTSEEEEIRQDIITKRAEMKAAKEEMELKREEMKLVMEKYRNGKELTTEETELMNSFKWNKMGKGKMRWHMGR